MMKGVASTLHYVIKFVAPNGIETLYGDQVTAKQCYLATMSTKAAMKEVQVVAERELLEDVGRTPEDKVVEELIHYELDEPSSDNYLFVDSNMKKQERIELIEFLKKTSRYSHGRHTRCW